MADSLLGSADSTPGAGSQSALRSANTRRVLACLTESGPMTQVALSKSTGLSPATISNLVAKLRSEGVVATSPTTSSGRRAVLVELGGVPQCKVAVGIDMGRRHLRIALCTLNREVVAEKAVGLPADHHAEDSIGLADRVLTILLERAGLERSQVVGCGVGIPGPIDAGSGKIAHGVILPAWVDFRPIDRLREVLRRPVYLDNDANLGGLAEITWGPYAEAGHLLYVKVGTGIGAGLVLSGQVYRGAMGITGEIGHIPVAEHGLVCRCGNRGCLETVASTSVMVEALVKAGVLEHDAGIARLVETVRAGDPAAGRVAEDAGMALGQVLGMMVNVLNPAVVVIGGSLVGLGGDLLGPVRRGIRRFASPTVSARTEVVLSSLGERAEVLGACSLVFQQESENTWLLPSRC
ncbi:Sugar kinase of the NBD/HSP70 family, may contain an N-terminal HTH domain [Austwickia chelonae]|uniref:Putative NagC family transcriptional regulator n=1 Tax=Austwickia chelonae NBRC 105200 TaxID=1184607 RepID=K6W452_9MICO|nr:ROK family transcriptional regulator [Austwickia chelonae]GAB76577.1 putative NagC family transcriptional regulator [Austwickia chelonae NBRC 105200]SEW27229.1 Sugar kinase of the NBD/HSP70 family, may contain an N-terminal HTH domain [Austwickia chelonae]